MQHALHLADVYEQLRAGTTRPRYAFMVLTLIAEAASANGESGPYVMKDGKAVPIRDWLCLQLMPMTTREDRRERLKARVIASLASQMTGETTADAALLELELMKEAVRVGKANVSRTITELVNAGLMSRYYAGRVKDHANRGGRRVAVYKLMPDVMAAVRTRNQLV